MIGRTCSIALVAGLTVLSAGCDGTSGLEGSGEARVLLSRAGSEAAASELALVAAEQLQAAELTLEAVSSIDVTIDRVELHRADAEEDGEEEEGGAAAEGEGEAGEGEGEEDGSPAWVSLEVEETALDLMALPVDGGVQIAAGEVEAASYDQVRLFVSGATITLDEQVVIGAATTLEPGTYELTIPSSEQTGIKVNTGIEVTSGASGVVALQFDAGTSVQNVTWTGIGILMSPVLSAEAEGEAEAGS